MPGEIEWSRLHARPHVQHLAQTLAQRLGVPLWGRDAHGNLHLLAHPTGESAPTAPPQHPPLLVYPLPEPAPEERAPALPHARETGANALHRRKLAASEREPGHHAREVSGTTAPPPTLRETTALHRGETPAPLLATEPGALSAEGDALVLFDPSAPLSLEHRADLFALLAHELERLRAPRLVSGFAGLVGNSPPMRELFRLLEKVAESDATVLIQGENGTGKGRLAHAIHQRSHRKDGPFLAQNCSALNDNLLDSELFGHKRGSFTGAIQDKPGLFTVADGGTFFLDEVGDTSPRLQVKLLRVLEEGSFLPIGETSPRRVSVRVIAATNRNLQRMVEAGSFREDLYFRLHVLRVVVPPLRERREDIPLLIDHFLRTLQQREEVPPKQLSTACERRLLSYSWPGNVRELENELNRLWVLSGDAPEIDTRWLSPRIQGEAPAAPLPTLPAAVEALERRMIAESLRRHRQNKTHAAQELGISRRNLIRLCQSYGLDSSGE